MSPRRPLAAIALLVTLTVSACGTTVPQLRQQSLSTGDGTRAGGDGTLDPVGDGTTGPGAATDPTTTGRVGGTTSVAGGTTADVTGGVTPVGPGAKRTSTGATPGPRSVATRPGVTATRPAGAAKTSSGAFAKGITATTVAVGITYVSNADALNNSVGAGNVATGDIKGQYEAVIAYYNSHGGFAGRTILPDYFALDATSTSSTDAQEAAACAHFTQDHHDFMVFGNGGDGYRKCLADAGVIQVNNNFPFLDARDFTPNLFELGSPSYDRIAAYLPTDLKAQGYFTPWNTTTGAPATVGTVKVGIVAYEGEEATVNNILVPGIKKLGYSTDVKFVTPPSTAADEGNVAAQVSSYELAFASEMVDHVIVFDVNGALTLFFAEAASTQEYHPRYGGSTANGFEVTIDTGATPKDEFNGAMGFSWFSLDDLTAAQDPDTGPYSNDRRRACTAIYATAGFAYASRDDERGQIAFCDMLTMVRQSLTVAAKSGPPTEASFIAGAESLGTSYVPGLTFGGLLGVGHHDAPDGAYDEQFSSDCGCMKYVGSVKAIP